MNSQRGQTFLIELSANLVRRTRALLDRPDSPYEDLNELVSTALENQLVLQAAPDQNPQDPPNSLIADEWDEDDHLPEDTPDPSGRPKIEVIEGGRSSAATDEDLLRPPNAGEIQTREPLSGSSPLFVLTNKLNPFALAARVLVNLTTSQGPPKVDTFVDRTSRIARKVGLQLRRQDQRAKRKDWDRRWIGWPVGEEFKSLGRFRRSFLFTSDTSPGSGPFVDLGLGVIESGHVIPTARSVSLAHAPSAILRETQGWTLGSEQQELLKEALLSMEGERKEILGFFQLLAETDFAQSSLDRKLLDVYSDWTESRVIAHRAAMIGRLRDVGLLDVSKKRTGVYIFQEPSANSFLRTIATIEKQSKTANG